MYKRNFTDSTRRSSWCYCWELTNFILVRIKRFSKANKELAPLWLKTTDPKVITDRRSSVRKEKKKIYKEEMAKISSPPSMRGSSKRNFSPEKCLHFNQVKSGLILCEKQSEISTTNSGCSYSVLGVMFFINAEFAKRWNYKENRFSK